MKGLRVMLVVMAALLAFVTIMGPAAAWGASQKIAAVDDYSSVMNDRVYSHEMGSVWYSDYESTVPGLDIQTVEPANVNAATLAGYDTLFLFACNPAVFTAQQKTDILNFVKGGGKLIIWDSEDPWPGSWNYDWLGTPFTASVPGAAGARGTLFIVAENELSTWASGSGDPLYINNVTLSTQTDAIGDCNVFTQYIPSQWCVDMTAINTLGARGPAHVYSTSQGSGIIIYSGLDWDYADFTGWSTSQPGYWLKKMLRQEFTAANLPPSGSAQCTPPPPGLLVEKTADKSSYHVGDTATFTITITNPSTYTASNVVVTEYPPSAFMLTSPNPVTISSIGAGQTATVTFTANVVEAGCGVENSVSVVGYWNGVPIFNGGDTIAVDIDCTCPPGQVCTPEFPSLALPVGMILGFVFVVYSLARKE